MLTSILAVSAVAMLSSACNEVSGDSDESEKFTGTRYKATLTRAVEENTWIAVTGEHEWWFFGGGVFKQISSSYVEPQYYGASQACNGQASGSYTMEETSSRVYKVTLAYDGSRDVSGACRMEDRTLSVTLQPSVVVDVVDGRVVQRLDRVESLPQ